VLAVDTELTIVQMYALTVMIPAGPITSSTTRISMPYIKQERRPYLQEEAFNLVDLLQKHGNGLVVNSDVAYVVYLLVKEIYGEGDWEFMSDALKVLEDVKLEFYRKVLAPYADKKIDENGDV
jgi:hypothetical protein